MGLCFKKPLSPFIKKWINPSPSIVHFHPCLKCYYSIVLYISIPVGSVIIQFYIHMCNMYIHLCVTCYHSIVNIHPCLACYHLILNIHPCLAWYYFYLVLHIRPCLKCYHSIVLYISIPVWRHRCGVLSVRWRYLTVYPLTPHITRQKNHLRLLNC